jgi:hypothetical protein
MRHIGFPLNLLCFQLGASSLPIGDATATITSTALIEHRGAMMKSIGCAILLLTMAGAAAAKDKCDKILWFRVCDPTPPHRPIKAPEIDPASAMAALTLMAGGLAVLRGRRTKNSKA